MKCSTAIFADLLRVHNDFTGNSRRVAVSVSIDASRCILTLFLATVSDSSHHRTVHYDNKESFDATHYCQRFPRLSLSSSILGTARHHGYPLGYDCINVARYNPTRETSISSVRPSMGGMT
mmetsp:Transcript_8890/g.16095  ORF Transcript_8890/g.16095 Transcript_8890/m.16095 type:complete len:121 (-) Transcript_8890:671-1033(-)